MNMVLSSFSLVQYIGNVNGKIFEWTNISLREAFTHRVILKEYLYIG